MRSPPYPSDITDEQWSLLEPLIPRAAENCRPRQTDMREVVIRLGDIVFFDRTGPKKVALRVLSPEEAAKVSGKKYRIDRGSKPGSFKLTQLED